MTGHPIASCARLATVDVDGERSRVVGALLWFGFGATALLVVLATFLVAFGDDDRDVDESRLVPQSVVDAEPIVARAPLTVDERGASQDALPTIVDAHTRAFGLVPSGAWATVPPGTALPSVPGQCALIAIVSADRGGTIDGPHTGTAGRVSFAAACPAAPRSSSATVLARAFVIPRVTLDEVTRAGIPPLVYFTHLLIEHDAGYTPFRPGDGVLRHALTDTGFSPAGVSRCVAWIGVITQADGIVKPDVHSGVACSTYTPLPTSTVAGEEIWLRPYIRLAGAHRERSDVLTDVVRRPMRTSTDADVIGTLAAAP